MGKSCYLPITCKIRARLLHRRLPTNYELKSDANIAIVADNGKRVQGKHFSKQGGAVCRRHATILPQIRRFCARFDVFPAIRTQIRHFCARFFTIDVFLGGINNRLIYNENTVYKEIKWCSVFWRLPRQHTRARQFIDKQYFP